jgi:hypothetical protein
MLAGKTGRESSGHQGERANASSVGKRTLAEQLAGGSHGASAEATGEARGASPQPPRVAADPPLQPSGALPRLQLKDVPSGGAKRAAPLGGLIQPAQPAAHDGGTASAPPNTAAASGDAVAASASAPTLRWKTNAVAPGAPATRFTVGPGESVTFTGSRPGAWSASGGAPMAGGNAETFDWKAPAKPGIYVVKLNADGKEATQGISVLAPTSVHFTKSGQDNAPAGQAGVKMALEMELGAHNVSFSEIEIREQPGGAAVATGPFAKMPNAHHPNPKWTSIDNVNFATAPDEAFAGPFDLPVAMGTLVWDIPYLWQPVGGGAATPFAIAKQTMSIVDSRGTMTITKGAASASWTPAARSADQKSAPDVGHAVESETPAAGGEIAAAGTWLKVVPMLRAKNHDKGNLRDEHIATVDNKPGEAPTVSYNPKTSEQVGGQGADAVDAVIQAIIAARRSIPARSVARDKPNGNVGNYYNPDTDTTGVAADYKAWRSSRRPHAKFTAGDPKDEAKWQIFTQLWHLEGDPGLVTTFDNTLSIGVGFSTAGLQPERILSYAFAKLPDLEHVAFAAGLAVNGTSMTVVDTQNKILVSGFAAAAYVQTVPELISFISNITIGVQTDAQGHAPDADAANQQRQTMLDAQWVAFLGSSVRGIPDEILKWELPSVTLAVHARHALTDATFPWSVFVASGPGVENLLRTIHKIVKKPTTFLNIANVEYRAPAMKILDEGKRANEQTMLGIEQQHSSDSTEACAHEGADACDGVDHQ